MKLLLVFPLLFSAACFAHNTFECESLLKKEFSRIPNDTFSGRISGRVPMSVQTLTEAYRRGIFPWELAANGDAVWYSPPLRGVLDFATLKIPRKDMQFIRRELGGGTYSVTFDQAFSEVIRNCAETARLRKTLDGVESVEVGSWIVPEFQHQFTEMFHAGFAHSVEVWKNGELVGGLYGTFVDGVFTGESMFHKESDVLKLALYALIERLKERGHTWIDTQQVNGLIKKWGGEKIPRPLFLNMLKAAQAQSMPF